MKYFFIKNGEKKMIDFNDEKAKPVLSLEERHVIKITCNDKYIITKCGSLEWLCKELSNTFGKYQRKGIDANNIYCKFVKYCYDNSIHKVHIECLFSSDNGYDVLKFELDKLSEVFGKKECLNTLNIPYIPKTIHAKKGSNWLTQNQYLNFMKLLKKYEY